MNSLISKNIDAIKRLCEKYEVKSMYLFGSGSKGKLHETSDIDILITFHDIPIDRYTDNYFNLHYRKVFIKSIFDQEYRGDEAVTLCGMRY